MAETSSQSNEDQRLAIFQRIAEEKIGARLTAVENTEKQNLDLLKTLDQESKSLIEQSSGWLTELDEALAKREQDAANKKSNNPEISIDDNDDGANGKGNKKAPSSTRELKSGGFGKGDDKNRRPSDVSGAPKPVKSLNDVSAEEHKTNKRPVTAKDTKKDNKPADKKGGQEDKKDDKKTVPPKTTPKNPSKDDKKAGGKTEETKEEEPATPPNPELEAILASITPNQISDLKVFKNAQAPAPKTLQAASQLAFGKAHTWDEVRTRLSDAKKFLKALTCFEHEKAQKKNVEAVQKSITDNNLNAAALGTNSAPATAIYNWLIAALKLVDPAYNSPEDVERIFEENNPENPDLKTILDEVNQTQVTELKALKKVPDAVTKTFQAVLELATGKTVAWKDIVSNYVTNWPALRKALRVQLDSVAKHNIETASKTITDSHLTEATTQSASPVAGQMYKWVTTALKIADPSYNSPEETQRLQEEAERLEEEKNPEREDLKTILDEIKPAHLVELKAMKSPLPSAIKIVQAISHLTHGKASEWKELVKSHLVGSKELHKTLKIDFANASKEHVDAAKKVITDGKLTEDNAKKASLAIAALYKWLIAAIKIVDPEYQSPEEVAAQKAEAGGAEEKPEETKTNTTKKGADKAKDTKKDTKKDDKDKDKKPVPTPAKTTGKTQPAKEDKKTAPPKAGKKGENAEEDKAEENKSAEGQASQENTEKPEEAQKDDKGKDKEKDKKTPAPKPTKTQPAKDDKKTGAKTTAAKDGEADKKAPGATPAKTTAKTQPAKEEKKTGPTKPSNKKEADAPAENAELKALADEIEKNVLAEMKSMTNAPAQVNGTAQVVSILTQGKTSDWKSLVKTHFADLTTLHKALRIDPTKITQKNLTAAKKLIEEQHLSTERVQSASIAAGKLIHWAEAAIRIAESSHNQANGDSQKVEHPAEENKTEEQTQSTTEVKTEEKTEENKPDENKPEQQTSQEHHEEKPVEETPNNHVEEPKPETKEEVHLNGDQAHQPEKSAEAEEQKSESIPNGETHNEESSNHQALNGELSQVLGHDVSAELNNGDVKQFVQQKVKDFESQIAAITAQNEQFRTDGVAENPERKPYEVKESTKGFIQMVEPGWVNELIQNPEWDDKIYQVLALFFALHGGSEVPDLENKEAIKAYACERLQKEEGNIADFLMSIEKHLDLPIEKKIKVQDFLKDKGAILNPNSFDGVDGLCGVISFLMKEASEYLGVQPIENVKKTSAKEKIYLLNQEKVNYYNERQNKLIEVAHKHNVPLDA